MTQVLYLTFLVSEISLTKPIRQHFKALNGTNLFTREGEVTHYKMQFGSLRLIGWPLHFWQRRAAYCCLVKENKDLQYVFVCQEEAAALNAVAHVYDLCIAHQMSWAD